MAWRRHCDTEDLLVRVGVFVPKGQAQILISDFIGILFMFHERELVAVLGYDSVHGGMSHSNALDSDPGGNIEGHVFRISAKAPGLKGKSGQRSQQKQAYCHLSVHEFCSRPSASDIIRPHY